MHALIHRPTRTRTLALAASALVLTGTLAGCGQDRVEASVDPATSGSTATPGTAVVVGDPWVRATVGTEDPSMSAAFMTVDNPGDEAVSLVAASSPVAGRVELHEMTMVDGAMAMQAVEDGIVLEPGRGKVLEPGGYHVMLMDLREDLAAGDEVELTLELSDGSTVDLTAPVKEFVEEEGHYHAPGTGEHGHDDEADDAEGHTR